MTTCYVIHFSDVNVNKIIQDLEILNPDKIVIPCLEEYDYDYIFRDLFEPLNEYLVKNNKTCDLIAPYNSGTTLFDTINIEECLGYYHWARGTVKDCLIWNIQFEFTDNTKLFTSYNNNCKYQRAMLIDSYVKNDLLNSGIVTWIQPECRLPNGDSYQYQYHDGSQLYDESDFSLNSKLQYNASNIPRSYLNGFIDIVSESTYDVGQYFLTEKTAKPIGTLKPFLIFGCPNINQHLRDSYGLEWYTELFDYSFDSMTDVQDRINGITENLLRLKQKPINELKDIYQSILPKVLNNRKTYYDLIHNPDLIPKSLQFQDEVEFHGLSSISILDIVKNAK